jgi:hypothetical protein
VKAVAQWCPTDAAQVGVHAFQLGVWMEERGRAVALRLDLAQNGQINRARLIVFGIRHDAVCTQFQHVRDAKPRPRAQSQKCAVYIAQRVQPVERRVNPAIDWHISGAFRVAFVHGCVWPGIGRQIERFRRMFLSTAEQTATNQCRRKDKRNLQSRLEVSQESYRPFPL